MSGAVKSVKKVFKSVGHALSKIVKSKAFKVVLAAVAIYFTGGLALGAMGSATAAALPGIASAASAMGIEAGAFAAGASTLAVEGAVTAGAVTAGTEAAGIAADGTLLVDGAGVAGSGGAAGSGAALGGGAGGATVGDAAVDGLAGANAAPVTSAPASLADAGGQAAGMSGPSVDSLGVAPDGTLATDGAGLTFETQAAGPTAPGGFFQQASQLPGKAWDTYKALPWQTQMMVGQAGMQGVSAMMQARQQQQLIDEQNKARIGNRDPVALTPIKPGFYARAGG